MYQPKRKGTYNKGNNNKKQVHFQKNEPKQKYNTLKINTLQKQLNQGVFY